MKVTSPRLFDWTGSPPASKSVLNRLLILRSFERHLEVAGESDCEDVLAMRAALQEFERARAAGENEATLECGAAGAVLRFLAPRVAREPGRWFLTGDARLFARPQAGLIASLGQLGVSAGPSGGGLLVQSETGWRKPASPVSVDRATSSQFASGLALSSCDLPFNLEMKWTGGAIVSDGYWEMSAELLRARGIEIKEEAGGAFIRRGQALHPGRVSAEPDVSSAFALAALAAVGGHARLIGFPFGGLQPDLAFAGLLRAMGARAERVGDDLVVEAPPDGLRALPEARLTDAPDLFPVLAVLCAYADGVSCLVGAPHLAHKESSRIESTLRLLRLVGARAEPIEGGMRVVGMGLSVREPAEEMSERAFEPENDHRLAMAAAVVNLARERRGEPPIRILHPEVVGKSFPGFWDVVNAGRKRARA